MQTSRFQLGLITTLAVGLGFSLASSQAVGYPAGAAVSMGTNPIISTGGTLLRNTSADLFVAPADSDIVITDVAMDPDEADGSCFSNTRMTFSIESTGEVLGRRNVSHGWWTSSVWHTANVGGAMASGMRVPAGETLVLTAVSRYDNNCDSSGGISYTVAGYHAQS